MLQEQCPESECLVLYPGASYEVGSPHDSEVACQKYAAQYARIPEGNLSCVQPVAEEKLLEHGAAVLAQIRKSSGIWRLLFRDSHVHVKDLNRSLRLSLMRGITPSERPATDCDAVLSSECLDYIFGHPWGLDTVMISGRIRIPDRRRFRAFLNLFRGNARAEVELAAPRRGAETPSADASRPVRHRWATLLGTR
jgi:hypothetical protein